MHLPSFLRNSGRIGAQALAIASALLLTGCDLNFWRMDGHQSTMVVDGPVARSQLELFYVTCWVTFVLFVIVGAVLAYATIKFRARSDSDEHAEPPEQGHGNPFVEVGLIAGSVFALVIIAIPTLKGIWYTYEPPADQKANTYTVTATAKQWFFNFDYPSEQIAGAGNLRTSNELVIPAGRPVAIDLRTEDVIHSFWVPKLGGKVDMIPNRGNHLWLEADAPGYFWGQCAEYCGDSHAVMRFRVIALSDADFKDWLAKQKAPARDVAAPAAAAVAPSAVPKFASFTRNQYGFTAKWDPAASTTPLENWKQQQQIPQSEDAALIAQGKLLFLQKACIACHTIRGHLGAAGTAGPDLTHVGSHTTIAAGLLENNPDQLARWIMNPGEVKPGNKMAKGFVDYKISVSPADAAALVAYLSSLK